MDPPTAGPGTRSTQIFINLGSNEGLDDQGFAPFGVVADDASLEVAQRIYNPTPGDSNGIDQSQYEENGNDYVRKQFPNTNFILGAACSEQGLPPPSAPSSFGPNTQTRSSERRS